MNESDPTEPQPDPPTDPAAPTIGEEEVAAPVDPDADLIETAKEKPIEDPLGGIAPI